MNNDPRHSIVKPVTLMGIVTHFVLATVIIVMLSAFYFYVYLPHTTNHGETVTVPDLRGKDIGEVQGFIAKHDLRIEVDSSYSINYPPLIVLKQFPAPGSKVKENRKVYIAINRTQPPSIHMPNLVDLSIIGALELLKGNELKHGKIEQIPSPFPTIKEMKLNGRILKPNEKIAKGSVIDLVVGDGNTL